MTLENVTEALAPKSSFTIPEGGRFAIEVLWVSTAEGDLEIHCNPPGDLVSKVTSPTSDPGYPVPELPTIILFSAGLIALATFLVLKRHIVIPKNSANFWDPVNSIFKSGGPRKIL